MTVTSRWPARIALLITAVMVAAVMGAWDAYGGPGGLFPVALQTTASPTPSESENPCDPVPLPVCPIPGEDPSESGSASSSPSGSSSASPSGSASPSPGGEPQRHDAVLTIKYPDPAFKGVVRTNARCKDERDVVLRRIRRGPDTVIGRDTTGPDGKWKVREPNANGRFYAKVLRRAFADGQTEVICKGDRSPTRRV